MNPRTEEERGEVMSPEYAAAWCKSREKEELSDVAEDLIELVASERQATEREICTWLRKHAAHSPSACDDADAIERGEYRKGEVK